ncbi:carbamoyl-phosphate synthase large subunit [Occallatibacter riparius]|uniref:Carbamoyl phosphate synthase large chain n=1 Tax=Occallatibacter riparius TaxID=1002689 RepID=A0A9J7BMT3_9BACT|nr:carbamoyl-phosphate synthase large subunit [Occallatibacter riparius]UWZ83066.1 carbamoyl-phosphate synthase large subunit [Occallatibacter riparius]
MPRRNDIQKILVIGSGPIVIGQSAEFDYSGTQACKALKAEGYEVVLVNSNPATIMTDPELADRTYIEPLTVGYVEEIIRKEAAMLGAGAGKFALLPTVGGQTALNLAVDLSDAGILDKYNVELIGAKLEAIKKAEDRLLFKDAMLRIGLDVSKSALVNNLRDGLDFAGKLGFPVLIRPSFTLGGSGGGIAYNREELMEILARGLDLSPVHECLIEESVLGWKEYELEVMRDLADNVIIICSIENFDPMGVHTGDSITVAPAQTLTDREYQKMRDAAIAVMREIGVETGGSNVQFAVNPADGRMTVIEMNPRVSRSSALASKATGFPIAKIAAKLAVGYTLDEIPNDITRKTPACFEPTIDYVVTKIPKWQFEKFPGADDTLGPQMKSVGEVMAIGRTFKESLMKAWRALETGKKTGQEVVLEPRRLTQMLVTPKPERLAYIRFAFERGMSVREVARLTGMDPWFLHQIREITLEQQKIAKTSPEAIDETQLRKLKRMGLSDERIATEWMLEGHEGTKRVRELRESKNIRPVFKLVDTCAAEFESMTPYLYSTYDEEDEAPPTDKDKIIILGSGPNRIGQGIEFDYCCCHAAFALKEDGYETIMVNCNPETVSTDYDTSDRLYFEPLVLEDVLAIYNHEASSGAKIGVIVQYGGQTPLNLAQRLRAAGVPIIGTSPESIDLAEDRKRFGKLLEDLKIPQPAGGTATSVEEALAVGDRIGYPVLVRPSYVLGGRAMVIAYDAAAVATYMRAAVEYSQERPVLVDHFLENAVEVDVDALCDSKDVIIAGIMQHIEEAGIHSGDSSCVLPAVSIREETLNTIREYTRKLALSLKVIGLVNIQFAIQRDANDQDHVYVIEVNPRASRTVPYVSKATGVPLAKVAARLMTGRTLAELLPEQLASGKDLDVGDHFYVKSPVFPWNKFAGVDTVLGPEMKSTGEVMGVAETFGEAFAKAQLSAGQLLPLEGTVFFSVNDHDKSAVVELARRYVELGFKLIATEGTARVLQAGLGFAIDTVFKVKEGRPNVVDLIKGERIQLVINTPRGQDTFFDEKAIRRAAVLARVPTITTIAAAQAAAEGIAAMQRRQITAFALQKLHEARA